MEKLNIGVISDLHGRNIWKKLIKENPQVDKWVFIGDYCDSFFKTNEEIYSNLVEIIEYKKENPEKAILLWGNHDLSYLFVGMKYRAEGFRVDMANQLEILFKENVRLFQVAYQYKNYLLTHAGVSNKWYNKYEQSIKDFWELIHREDEQFCLADILNAMFESRHRDVICEMSNVRNKVSVNGRIAGMLWADISETREDYLDNYHQIVGHTPRKDIITLSYNGASITYTDCLAETEEFYQVEI